jgi:sarcosine oxidase delta subunit
VVDRKGRDSRWWHNNENGYNQFLQVIRDVITTRITAAYNDAPCVALPTLQPASV